MICRPFATDEHFSEWEELTSRKSDGCAVSLLWHPATNRVKVAVADISRSLDFEFDVDGANALSAFHHPFAFAAAEASPSTRQTATSPIYNRRVERKT